MVLRRMPWVHRVMAYWLTIMIGFGHIGHAVAETPLPTCLILFDREATAIPWNTVEWVHAGERLAAFLKHERLAQCLDFPKSIELLAYYEDEHRADGVYHEIDRTVDLAKEHWFNFELAEALAVSEHALSLISEQTRLSSDQDFIALGDRKVEVLLIKALVLKGMGHKKDVRKVFAEALDLHPHLEIDALEFPPSYRKIFSQVKAERFQAPQGTLDIATLPQAARVYLNGVRYGETPLRISELPYGQYEMVVFANRYLPVREHIAVEHPDPITRKISLEWKPLPDPYTLLADRHPLFLSAEADTTVDGADTALLSLMKQAIQRGATLDVSKVILLRAAVGDAAVSESALEVRVLDVAFEASHHPVVAPLSLMMRRGDVEWKAMAAPLAQVMNETLLDDPERKLDPRTADMVVVSRAKRPFYRHPAFWVGVGAVVVGGTIGGIMAATHGDGDGAPAASGSVDVGLEDF